MSLMGSVYYLVALVLALTIHEFTHAWIADQLGDPTARFQGRISLNPIVHLDPLGALMILLMAFRGIGFGWGKPVPVNPNNLRSGPIVGGAMVSAAGPLSNILFAGLVAIPLRFLITPAMSAGIADFLWVLFQVNIFLAIFNLLPIPPLDGFSFWTGLLHELPFSATRQLWWLLTDGRLVEFGPMLLLFIIFFGGGVLWYVINPVFRFFAMLFLGI